MRKTYCGINVECIRGDIAGQSDITAIVNAANAQLQPGGGVAGAIHRAAGPGLARECRPMAPITPGVSVISGGHKLPNRFVIHCLGPVYGLDEPSDILLANCYRNALLLADGNKIDSIAFPAISTGAFGYPVEPAAEIAFRTIRDTTPLLKNIRLIRMVLNSQNDLEIHEKTISEIL
jgi:O-acetyl-ADP-ribose deacetylase (regulator of RNase III)